jgi:hypothetical protein
VTPAECREACRKNFRVYNLAVLGKERSSLPLENRLGLASSEAGIGRCGSPPGTRFTRRGVCRLGQIPERARADRRRIGQVGQCLSGSSAPPPPRVGTARPASDLPWRRNPEAMWVGASRDGVRPSLGAGATCCRGWTAMEAIGVGGGWSNKQRVSFLPV